jgi:alcohol dehydrogenase
MTEIRAAQADFQSKRHAGKLVLLPPEECRDDPE